MTKIPDGSSLEDIKVPGTYKYVPPSPEATNEPRSLGVYTPLWVFGKLQVFSYVSAGANTKKFYFRVRIHSGDFGKWYEIDPDTAEMLIQLCGWINEHIEEAQP